MKFDFVEKKRLETYSDFLISLHIFLNYLKHGLLCPLFFAVIFEEENGRVNFHGIAELEDGGKTWRAFPGFDVGNHVLRDPGLVGQVELGEVPAFTFLPQSHADEFFLFFNSHNLYF